MERLGISENSILNLDLSFWRQSNSLEHSSSSKNSIVRMTQGADSLENLTNSYKNKYPEEYKRRICKLVKVHGIKKIQEKTGICKKNIERWITQGICRKKGAGRKTVNPEMEQKIILWVIDYIKSNRSLKSRSAQEKGDHQPSKTFPMQLI